MIATKLSALEWFDRLTYKKNVLFGEKELRSQGAKFQVVIFKPHTGMGTHCHGETVEVFYVLSGKGSIRLAGEVFHTEPNDIFLCEPGDWHSFQNDSDEDFVILNVKTNEKEGDIVWEGEPRS
jgi:mannose-6-phosphate isomerase-like protein (cupin superfamily)